MTRAPRGEDADQIRHRDVARGQQHRCQHTAVGDLERPQRVGPGEQQSSGDDDRGGPVQQCARAQRNDGADDRDHHHLGRTRSADREWSVRSVRQVHAVDAGVGDVVHRDREEHEGNHDRERLREQPRVVAVAGLREAGRGEQSEQGEDGRTREQNEKSNALDHLLLPQEPIAIT